MTQELELMIRAGKFSEVRKLLRAFPLRKIKRADVLAYANLARRVELSPLSLRILNPIVRPDKARKLGKERPATPDEKIEYAASLRNLGMISEAAELLRAIGPQNHALAAFHLALCLMQEWRYHEAIPHLKAYVASFQSPVYALQVGKVNLLSALIHEGEYGESRRLGELLLRELEGSTDLLLHRNTIELMASLEVATRNWSGALRYLKKGSEIPGPAGDSIYGLRMRKWQAVVHSAQAGKVLPELVEVAASAVSSGTWEIQRDCLFYTYSIAGNWPKLQELYFGTPYASYRQKILEAMPLTIEMPEHYIWSPTSTGIPEVTFDLVSAQLLGENRKAADALPIGQELHRLLILLLQDFYRPFPILSLYSRLFPGEWFHPSTSPNRVHRAIARLRRWTEKAGLPVRPENIDGGYRLQFSGPIAFRIPKEPAPITRQELEFEHLRTLLGLGMERQSFTTLEACRIWGVSLATTKRLLKWAVESGKLEQTARTCGATYLYRG